MFEFKKSVKSAREGGHFLRELARRGKKVKTLDDQLELLDFMEKFGEDHKDDMSEKKYSVWISGLREKRKELLEAKARGETKPQK
jgi:hypothetical protein